MATQIFVNLAVKDLKKSIEFFSKLDFTFDPKFTNENATCMIVAENIFVMLLVESFFKTFIKKELCDAAKSTEVLVCLSVDSRQKVEDLVNKAISAGGITPSESKDYGFMYQHGFQDLDGHLWELVFMDPSKPFPG